MVSLLNKLIDVVYDVVQLLLVHFSMNGKRYHSLRQPVGHRQIHFRQVQKRKHFLTVRGNRIINHGRNTHARQLINKCIAIHPIQHQCILMKNMGTEQCRFGGVMLGFVANAVE